MFSAPAATHFSIFVISQSLILLPPYGMATKPASCLIAPSNLLLLTTALQRGLLPGILRRTLIEEGRAIEADLTPADLAHGFYIGNALRGLVRAQLVASAAQPGL